MKGKSKRRHVLLILAVLWIALLTGCPPRASQEEIDDRLETGRTELTQAMEKYYGLGEGDYQILSEKIRWGSAYGYNAVEYQLQVGDTELKAIVDSDKKEVYTDYYRKEFEEVFLPYLNERLESIPELKEMKLRILTVDYAPWRLGLDFVTLGTIPASLAPEGFEDYLKECEKKELLMVQLTTAWYSVELKEVSGELQNLLRQGANRFPSDLIIRRFACEEGAELTPTDLKETYSFDNEGNLLCKTYEYLEVNDRLTIQREFYGKGVKQLGEKPSFEFLLRSDGSLFISPDDDYYNLFIKDGKEGTYLPCYKTKDSDWEITMPIVKDPCFENWGYVSGVKGSWYTMVEDVH